MGGSVERAALGFRLSASHALVRSEELGVRSGGAAQKIMKRREYIWGDARKSYEMTLFSYRQPSPCGEGSSVAASPQYIWGDARVRR